MRLEDFGLAKYAFGLKYVPNGVDHNGMFLTKYVKESSTKHGRSEKQIKKERKKKKMNRRRH